jgi:hypothetical protein
MVDRDGEMINGVKMGLGAVIAASAAVVAVAGAVIVTQGPSEESGARLPQSAIRIAEPSPGSIPLVPGGAASGEVVQVDPAPARQINRSPADSDSGDDGGGHGGAGLGDGPGHEPSPSPSPSGSPSDGTGPTPGPSGTPGGGANG